MINWIMENKEWLFSGLGILIITSIFGVIKFSLNKNKDKDNRGQCINQRQNGGEGSINVQIGNINKNKE